MWIEHIRLDSRLIHGQVVSFWANFLAINRIIVVSQDVIKDKMQVEMLKIACPTGIKLSVLAPMTLKTNFDQQRYAGERILVITDTVETLHKLMFLPQMTTFIPEINVGNLSTGIDKVAIKKSVYVNQQEYDLFLELANLGMKIDAKMIPNDEEVDFISLLKLKYKEQLCN